MERARSRRDSSTANPVIAVRHSEKKPSRNGAANEKNGRQRLAFVNSLQNLVRMQRVNRQKREVRGAQSVLRGVFNELL
jgi:hypothetical protein